MVQQFEQKKRIFIWMEADLCTNRCVQGEKLMWFVLSPCILEAFQGYTGPLPTTTVEQRIRPRSMHRVRHATICLRKLDPLLLDVVINKIYDGQWVKFLSNEAVSRILILVVPELAQGS